MLNLEEVKLYLRIDGDEEDTLITSLIDTAGEFCEEILRYPLSDFETVPGIVNQAMLYCIVNMYENRGSVIDENSIEEMLIIMKNILSSYRDNCW